MSIDQQNRVGNDVLELLVVRELGGDYGMMVRRLRNGSNGRVRRFYESLMKLDGVELDRIVDEVVNV